MDWPTMEWLLRTVLAQEVRGARVLEVGSKDVNGSIRGHIQAARPGSYHGVDIEEGPGVDAVVSVHDLVKEYGVDCFDVVISTEMLEHVPDWRDALHQMKAVLRPGGTLILTTRAPGFPRHCFPHDHWRFTPQTLRQAFRDFDVIDCRQVRACGAVIKARKPRHWQNADLASLDAKPAPSRDLRWSELKLWVFIAHRGRSPDVPKTWLRGLDQAPRPSVKEGGGGQ